MNADGTNVETLGSGFSSPSGVAVQSDGKIVIADNSNNAVKRITEASTTNRVAVTVNLPPTVTTFLPADDATNIAIDRNLEITFNEDVVKGTGNIILYDADHNVVETIDVTSALVSITNKVVTINPTSDLEKSKSYYVQIANTAFKDGLDNAFEGITDKTTWSFVTELKATQTITFGSLNHTTEDVFDLTATSSSGLSITYTSSNTDVATISGKTVTVLSAGSTTITAKQAGNSNYESAPDVTQVLTIITLGVEDDIALSEVMKLYPNPAVNFIKIDLGTIEKGAVKIFDINGKLLLNMDDYSSKEVLNISNLKIGVYFVKIESDKGNSMKKFIKKQ
jgi:methionine-rich copper-binding protein CopC